MEEEKVVELAQKLNAFYREAGVAGSSKVIPGVLA